MPPARTIFVDRDQILRSIAQIAGEQRADALAMDAPDWHPAKHTALRGAEWVPRDLPRLACKPLTASERKRHQEAVRAMEAEGLIETRTVRVRLTDAGRSNVASSQG